MQFCQFTKSFVMFHHITLSSLFPTGAQVLSPEAFSFRCDSKTLFPGAEKRMLYALSPRSHFRSAVLYLDHPTGMALLPINSQPRAEEWLMKTVTGQAGGGKTMYQRCVLSVLGSRRRGGCWSLRGTIGEPFEGQDGICGETRNESDFKQWSECEQHGNAELRK